MVCEIHLTGGYIPHTPLIQSGRAKRAPIEGIFPYQNIFSTVETIFYDISQLLIWGWGIYPPYPLIQDGRAKRAPIEGIFPYQNIFSTVETIFYDYSYGARFARPLIKVLTWNRGYGGCIPHPISISERFHLFALQACIYWGIQFYL